MRQLLPDRRQSQRWVLCLLYILSLGQLPAPAFVTKVDKKGAIIQSIHLDKGEIIYGNVFIDASYEGDLMARSGVSYTFGRESKDQYRESLAGIHFMDKAADFSPYDDKGKLLPGFARKDSLVEGQADKRVQNYNFRLLNSYRQMRIGAHSLNQRPTTESGLFYWIGS